MRNKLALGIHHLNVAYTIGDESSYHRQIREGIIHIFNLLDRHPTWCFSIEMSGFSIEFIANNYPSILDRMKSLIKRDQIELISATYSPQIWISFPKIDMVKSIEMNFEMLKRYQLPSSKIFFAQENFFGEGIKNLTKWFNTAVVKDDYYFHLHGIPNNLSIDPYYMLGDMKIIVGWGHILENVASELYSNDGNDDCKMVEYQNRAILQESIKKNHNRDGIGKYFGKYDSFEWEWFHIGSSERFAKANMRSENIDLCRFDPEWFFYVEKRLVKYEKDGYKFTSVGEFINIISESKFVAKPCDTLLDGAWNMKGCKGGFIWTGFNSNEFEDDLLVRNHNWRSRTRLVALETLLEKIQISKKNLADINNEVKKAWKHQVMSEVSDATGWYPDSSEVYYSIEQSETVMNIVSQIVNFIKVDSKCGIYVVDCMKKLIRTDFDNLEIVTKIPSDESFLNPQLFGASGEFQFYKLGESIQRIIIDFKPEEISCGVRFKFDLNYITYSPSLMDDETVCYNLDSFKPDKIYLPLPNGLIQVGEDVYIIKHNEYMNISCCVDREQLLISFEIENPKKRPIRWVITIFSGELGAALSLAQSINIYPIVCL